MYPLLNVNKEAAVSLHLLHLREILDYNIAICNKVAGDQPIPAGYAQVARLFNAAPDYPYQLTTWNARENSGTYLCLSAKTSRRCTHLVC